MLDSNRNIKSQTQRMGLMCSICSNPSVCYHFQEKHGEKQSKRRLVQGVPTLQQHFFNCIKGEDWCWLKPTWHFSWLLVLLCTLPCLCVWAPSLNWPCVRWHSEGGHKILTNHVGEVNKITVLEWRKVQ